MTALQLSSSSQLCLGMRRRRRRNCIFKIICPSLRGKNMWMKWIWCEIQAGTAISNITQGFIKHSKGISRFYLWNCSCARTAKARHVHRNRIATLNSLSWITIWHLTFIEKWKCTLAFVSFFDGFFTNGLTESESDMCCSMWSYHFSSLKTLFGCGHNNNN